MKPTVAHIAPIVFYAIENFADIQGGRGPPITICHGTMYHYSGFPFPDETERADALLTLDSDTSRTSHSDFSSADPPFRGRGVPSSLDSCPGSQVGPQAAAQCDSAGRLDGTEQNGS